MLKIIKALRFQESVLMTGFFLIGAVFSIKHISVTALQKLILIGLSCFFLIFSVYAFNAFFGRDHDKKNKRLSSLLYLKHTHFLIYALLFLCFSVLLSAWLGWKYCLTLIAIECIGLLYSMPVFGMKHYPFAGTILHFIAVFIIFNMVSSVFAPHSLSILLFSVYFSLCLAGGHLHHEVIDYEDDKRAGFRTGAVFLGINKTLYLSFFMFFSGAILLAILPFFDQTENIVAIIFLVGFIVQTVFFIYYKDKMPDNFSSRIAYRKIYRIIFCIACLIVAIINFR
ncbi:MAG: UbiA family prenyltransferase [Deltaproteobacteria bacterium]|nr:UbiA family prenyltransferase [Deltaproteobacteria bacterium]